MLESRGSHVYLAAMHVLGAPDLSCVQLTRRHLACEIDGCIVNRFCCRRSLDGLAPDSTMRFQGQTGPSTASPLMSPVQSRRRSSTMVGPALHTAMAIPTTSEG